MGTGAAAFVGRGEQLTRLREHGTAAREGRGAIVLLEGDAGSGKTRLLEEWKPDVCVAVLEYAGAPYAPVRDLLQALDARFPRILKGHPTLAAVLRPILDLKPFDAGAGGEQRQVFDAVIDALALYARSSPLALAIEDIHWCDPASASVLLHIARHGAALPLVLVLSYRGADAMARDDARTLLANLTRVAHDPIALPPLDEDQAMLLAGECAPAALPFDVRRSIVQLAQGNPLLVVELVRHASSTEGGLRSLPVSMQALVHQRLARFDETERDVLAVCAAMEIFEISDVAAIAGVSHEALLHALRKAREAGIVAEDGPSFVFRHALIRRAITGELLGVELSQLHARIARQLETAAQNPQLEQRLAYHYWMAGETRAAERTNVAAAERAVSVFAYDDAAVFFERAIGGRKVDDATLQLYNALADAYERGGRHGAASGVRRALFSHAAASGQSDRAAQSGIALSRSCFHSLDDEGSLQAVRAAIAAAGAGASPSVRFELYALLAWYLVHLRRLDDAQEALAGARELAAHGSGIALIRYHEARAAFEVHRHGGGSWKDEVEKAIAIAQELDPYVLLHRYTNAIALAAASELDAYTYIFDLIARVAPLVERSPASSRAAFLQVAGRAFLVCGRLAEARAAVEAMLPLAYDSPLYGFRAASVGIPVALHTGDEALLARCTRPRLLEEAFASNDSVVFGPVAAAVVQHMIAQSRRGEARALLDRTIARLERAGNNFDLLLLCARYGSAPSAARAIEMLEPWCERSVSARATMEVLRAQGCAGAERRAHANEAARLFAALPWPLHQAYALELGGDEDAARAIYAECGAHADERRLMPAKVGAAPLLSKRELEVALLVAAGKSNRAIAEALVLSERTVENHIASIFGKLAVRSRAEIASFVARENVRAV